MDQGHPHGAKPPPAKGPRACATCARAKSRCIPGPVLDVCERCHRLSKPCSSQTPAPPRKKKEPRPNRVAELERRLEYLRTRLQPSFVTQHEGTIRHNGADDQERRLHGRERQQPTPPRDSTGSPVKPFSNRINFRPALHLFPSDNISAHHRQLPQEDEPMVEYGSSSSRSSTSASPPQQRQDSDGSSNDSLTPGVSDSCSSPPPRASYSRTEAPRDFAWPDDAEAADLLTFYKTHMAPIFPFIVVPDDLTHASLRRQRPFLWKAVVMAGCVRDGERQIAMGNQLIMDIAVTGFMQPRRSLDLLQAVQMLLGWYHYNLNSFQTTNLLFLARSICVSLSFMEPRQTQNGLHALSREPNSVCLEEMRAFAGTFYLVSIVFTTNKKPDALMNTSYLDNCCEVLRTRMEYRTDALLVQLVRIQQLAQSISLTLAARNNGGFSSRSNVQAFQLDCPLIVVVRSFQEQLNAFRDGLSDDLRDNYTIQNHFYIARILLGEVALHDMGGDIVGHPNKQQSRSSSLEPTHRFELLLACVEACKGFMTNRFRCWDEGVDNGIDGTPRFCCLCAFDFIFAFSTSLRLLMLQMPGWDRNAVRAELRLIPVVDRQRQEIEALMAFRMTAERQRRQARGSASAETLSAAEAVPAGEYHGGELMPAKAAPSSFITAARTSAAGPGGCAPLSTDGRRPDPYGRLRQQLVHLRNVLETEASDAIRHIVEYHNDFAVLRRDGAADAAGAPPTDLGGYSPCGSGVVEASSGSFEVNNNSLRNPSGNLDIISNSIAEQMHDGAFQLEMDTDPWASVFAVDDDWDTWDTNTTHRLWTEAPSLMRRAADTEV